MQTSHDLVDSGIDWIDEIPTTWVAKRAKYLFAKQQQKPDSDDEVVTAFRDGEVILRKLRREEGFTFADKEIGYQHVQKGDLVVHAMDAFAGAIGVSKSDGKMSPVCSICKPVNKNISTRYYAYLLRSMTQTGYLIAIAKGIRERSTDFRYKDFSNMLLPVPDRETQDRIADFLDEETAKIDELIVKQEKLLVLLEEKRRTTITHTIEGGLKSSDTRTWTTKRIRNICKLNPHTEMNFSKDETVNFYPMESIGDDGKLSHSETRKYSDVKTGYTVFQNNDVVLAKVTPCFENYKGAPVTGVASHVGFGTTELFVLRPNDEVNSTFLYWVTQTQSFNNYLTGGMRGTGGLRRVVPEELKNYTFRMPPMEEQNRINAYIREQLKRITTLEHEVRTQITLLKERRTSLISHAVTGKIKV